MENIKYKNDGTFGGSAQIKFEKPFKVEIGGEELFSIEKNGDFILRGKAIANDKHVADILSLQGELLAKGFNNLNKSIELTSKIIGNHLSSEEETK